MTKYYLRFEIRYTVPECTEDERTRTHHTKVMESNLFDTEKEAMDLGNNIIIANQWIEQYPGYVGDRLNRRFGHPLVVPSLKNGASIFISVLPLNIMTEDVISEEMQKFNIPTIQKVVK